MSKFNIQFPITICHRSKVMKRIVIRNRMNQISVRSVWWIVTHRFPHWYTTAYSHGRHTYDLVYMEMRSKRRILVCLQFIISYWEIMLSFHVSVKLKRVKQSQIWLLTYRERRWWRNECKFAKNYKSSQDRTSLDKTRLD